jgi:hypothetical protein
MGHENRHRIHRIPGRDAQGEKSPDRRTREQQQQKAEQTQRCVLHTKVHGEIEQPAVAGARRKERDGQHSQRQNHAKRSNSAPDSLITHRNESTMRTRSSQAANEPLETPGNAMSQTLRKAYCIAPAMRSFGKKPAQAWEQMSTIRVIVPDNHRQNEGARLTSPQ